MTAPGARPLVGGRWELVRRLNTGGMAEVLLARAPDGREVVVKLLRDGLRGDPVVERLFRDEGRLGLRLAHPNVVRVLETGEHDGAPLLVMEHVAGEELADVLRLAAEAGRAVPLEVGVEIVRQAALGLAHVHAARDEEGRPLAIVHRDVSPSNLLMTRDGVVKLIDLGVAVWAGSDSAARSLVPGKIHHMSPEQARGEPLDARSDVYVLGAVLYELAVGRTPHPGSAAEAVRSVAEARVELSIRSLPAVLERIVCRCLAPVPAARPSAAELAAELEAFLADSGLHAGPAQVARWLDGLADVPAAAPPPSRLTGRAAGRATARAPRPATPWLVIALVAGAFGAILWWLIRP